MSKGCLTHLNQDCPVRPVRRNGTLVTGIDDIMYILFRCECSKFYRKFYRNVSELLGT